MKPTTKTKRRRPANSGRRSKGHGVLHEVRFARRQSQVLFAELLGMKRITLARAEQEGRAPSDREACHILLNMALEIPERERSEALDTWIAQQEAEFEARPLGGAFL